MTFSETKERDRGSRSGSSIGIEDFSAARRLVRQMEGVGQQIVERLRASWIEHGGDHHHLVPSLAENQRLDPLHDRSGTADESSRDAMRDQRPLSFRIG